MNIRIQVLLTTVLITVFTGCVTDPDRINNVGAQATNTDDLLVIDCLLPGQIRKLGQKFSYLAPRRPVKTSAVDCEIRGGEYVAYDRANYATALKIWLPQAQQGDPAAQTYVGEIYEKGLGLEADYQLARNWYLKAAEQGYARAQINLGYLYESGLGVTRNLVTAMNWYRKASGLGERNLEYVSSVEIAQREAAKRETSSLRQEVSTLRGELDSARQELQQRKARLRVAEADLSQLKQKLAAARQAPVVSVKSEPPQNREDPALRHKLERQLVDARKNQQRLIASLAEQQLEASELRQQLQASNRLLGNQRDELSTAQAALDRMHADLSRGRKSSASDEQTKQLQLQVKIDHLESVVANKKAEISLLEKENQARKHSIDQLLSSAGQQEKNLQQQLSERSREVAKLEMELSERSEILSSYKIKLNNAQQEQARLTSRLATQQLEGQQLSENLKRASKSLKERHQKLQATQSELAFMRQELARSQAVTASNNKQKTVALEARIAELETDLQKRQHEISSSEERFSHEQTRLSNKLALLQNSERKLQQTLNSRNQEIASLKTQVSTASKELSRVAGSSEIIAGLEQELENRKQEIARQKKNINKLESKIPGPVDKRDASEFAAYVASRSIGPTIEIIEPPVAIMRGTPTVALNSNVPELELIGRVSPASELMSFRINDIPRKIDNTGLFQAAIRIADQKTPVRAVAVDKAGKRASLDFVILPPKRQDSTPDSKNSSRKSVSSGPDIEFGNYHALIIGNNNYRHMTNLRTAKNDARAVAQVLKDRYGFKVNLLLDADRYTILSALNGLMQKLTEEDNLLIYYAGHGELDDVNLRGHWLPVDAELESTANWISNVAITDILNVMSAKHIMVVADSCYSGALTRSSIARLKGGMSKQSKLKWYQAMSHARTRTVLTSGGIKPVLDSGGGEHSIFAAAFLDVLRHQKGILEGYQLYREVQEKVKRSAKALQVEQDPQYAPIKYAGHEAGEFFLRPVDMTYLDNDRRQLLSAVLP